jgi:hypothetical protein
MAQNKVGPHDVVRKSAQVRAMKYAETLYAPAARSRKMMARSMGNELMVCNDATIPCVTQAKNRDGVRTATDDWLVPIWCQMPQEIKTERMTVRARFITMRSTRRRYCIMQRWKSTVNWRHQDWSARGEAWNCGSEVPISRSTGTSTCWSLASSSPGACGRTKQQTTGE